MNAAARLVFASSKCDHITPLLRQLHCWKFHGGLQAGSSGLQMSSWLGTVIPRWRTSSSSTVGVPKASAFRFVSWTVCSPYPTLNLPRPNFSSRRYTDLEQSSTAYHICSVTSCLLLLLEDILLRTPLPINYCCRAREVTLIYGYVKRSYLHLSSSSRAYETWNTPWVMKTQML